MPDVFAGRFELIDPIGSGGTGTVWRAWDRRLERLCAAKVLRQRHAGALLRFVREQGLRLDHPNVLSPYGWAADDDQALLAMDLVGGGSVSSLVADFGALPERYAAELLAQLLRALEQVHAAGLVHRDVKPANLLLETTGTGIPVLHHPKVGDRCRDFAECVEYALVAADRADRTGYARSECADQVGGAVRMAGGGGCGNDC